MPARKKLLVSLFVVLAIFLFLQAKIFAAMSLTISDAPSGINFDQEFEVLVKLENASHDIDYFLQMALTLPESTAYFGYTQKEDGTWYKYNETYDLFYKITTSQEGSWSGKLKGKPDIEDTNFKGTGPYLLKIGRFTSTGKSHYWSDNSLTINIAGPTPTPTPTPSPTPTPTPIPTSTSTPTPTPTPKPVSTSTPTPRPSVSPTVSPLASASAKAIPTGFSLVLGESVSSTAGAVASQKPKAQAGKSSNSSNLLTPIFLILGAFAVLGTGLSLFWLKRKKMYNGMK